VKHILIADDDSGMLHLMTRTLPGYRVTLARSGLEALAAASVLPSCDLLITDYMMTPMLGDELTGRLRAIRPQVKTLVVTSHSEYIDAGGFGADAQLAKPFAVGALRDAVSSLIGEA
jgi:CheY-like chemotaxis protein